MSGPLTARSTPGTSNVVVRAQHVELPVIDALAAYDALEAELGRDRVFLVESLSGGPQDRRSSYVVADPLMSMSVVDDRIVVEGCAVVAERFEQRSLEEGLVDRDGTALRLRHPFALWDVLRVLTGCFDFEGAIADRFSFGLCGYFGYDVVRAIEHLSRHLPPRDDAVPDVLLIVHRIVVQVDHDREGASLVVNDSPAFEPLSDDVLARIRGGLEATARSTPPREPDHVPPPTRVSDCTTAAQYSAAVEQALEHIAAGDIYQIQLGHEITVESPVDPLHVYRRLRRRNPSPFMYFGNLGPVCIIGASPELFVRYEAGTIVVRPIAGTIGRGSDPTQDEARLQQLVSDPKEVAEHLMLVDLCRNDVSRICERGQMHVPELMAGQRYSHVFHLVSTVTAQVRAGVDAFELLLANFPAGTMVGTPKVSAMSIIESLERSRRGLYSGVLALIDIGGHVNSALCIRTAVYQTGRYSMRASAGVVADSRPEHEWIETLNKLSACYWAVTDRELRDEHPSH